MLVAHVVFATAFAALAPCPDPARMVSVDAGPFWMGSDVTERRLADELSSKATRQARWFDMELPQQRVQLHTFCIDLLLVTQADYAAFVEATGHRVPDISKADYLRQGFLVHDYDREVTPYLWRQGRPPARLRDHPVVLVSAADAEAFCRWRRSGLRLPTEAEWEKATRGDQQRIFPWGNVWDSSRVNNAESAVNGTTSVTRYANGASPYGLLDAVGNVFQWTASSFADGRRILKGCAWDDDAGLCRLAFRHARPATSRHILIGFRCAAPAHR